MATLRELRSRTVLYDFEMRAIQQQKPGRPRSGWPTFLVQTLGQDFFHDVYAVNSADLPPDLNDQEPPPTTDQDRDRFWNCVTQFPHLRQLCVAGRWVDPISLARLRNPREMEILTIANCPVTDDELRVIGFMTRLKTLQIYGSHSTITDEGIAALDNLSDLEALLLSDSQITDAAAKHLARHPKLSNLQLVGTHWTDKSTPWLGQLTEMVQLSLRGTEISDAGLENLKNLWKLEHLYLDGTKITDEGLVHFAHLASLQTLTVRRTKVTPEGIGRFRQQRPSCLVLQ